MSEIENNENENQQGLDNLDKMATVAERQEAEQAAEDDALLNGQEPEPTPSEVKEKEQELQLAATIVSSGLNMGISALAAVELNDDIKQASEACGHAYAALIDKHFGVSIFVSVEANAIAATVMLGSAVYGAKRAQIEAEKEKQDEKAKEANNMEDGEQSKSGFFGRKAA